MDEKHRKFASTYLLNGGNGKAAAIAAGYSPRSAEVQASRLLKNAKVRAFLDARAASLSKKVEVDAEKILGRLADIAFSPIARFNDQIKALELLGKNLRLFTDKVELSGSIGLAERMREARERTSGRG